MGTLIKVSLCRTSLMFDSHRELSRLRSGQLERRCESETTLWGLSKSSVSDTLKYDRLFTRGLRFGQEVFNDVVAVIGFHRVAAFPLTFDLVHRLIGRLKKHF